MQAGKAKAGARNRVLLALTVRPWQAPLLRALQGPKWAHSLLKCLLQTPPAAEVSHAQQPLALWSSLYSCTPLLGLKQLTQQILWSFSAPQKCVLRLSPMLHNTPGWPCHGKASSSPAAAAAEGRSMLCGSTDAQPGPPRQLMFCSAARLSSMMQEALPVSFPLRAACCTVHAASPLSLPGTLVRCHAAVQVPCQAQQPITAMARWAPGLASAAAHAKQVLMLRPLMRWACANGGSGNLAWHTACFTLAEAGRVALPPCLVGTNLSLDKELHHAQCCLLTTCLPTRPAGLCAASLVQRHLDEYLACTCLRVYSMLQCNDVCIGVNDIDEAAKHQRFLPGKLISCL